MAISRQSARRFAQALLVAEFQRLRGRGVAGQVVDWPDTLPIGPAGLELDSLEQLCALAVLAEAFSLGDAQFGLTAPTTFGAWIDWVITGPGGAPARLTVRTSGSTGAPVSCTHEVADLVEEAAYLAGRLADRRRVLALVPANHLYGLIWTTLLPEQLGVPVIPGAIGTMLGLLPGDLVVAVPDQWRALSRLMPRLPADVVGVSSGAPLDDGVADSLLAGGLDRLIDIYGSSETSGVALREAPASEFELLPRWRLVCRPDGLWGLEDKGGVNYPLPDHVEPLGNQGLRLQGRRDGAVQVGGFNVWPSRVAELIRSVEGVADATVRLGVAGRLKAFVVPQAGLDELSLAPRLNRFVAERLSTPERPQAIRYGPALPRNEMGKDQDWI